MQLLRTAQDAATARAVLLRYQAQRDALPGDASAAVDRARIGNLLAQIERQIALFEAGIREPVPGTPDLVPSPWTVEAVNAMSEVEYERASRQAAVLAKRAEMAQIDRAIGAALDRIADWRRHRAWLEREIAELEAPAPVPAR